MYAYQIRVVLGMGAGYISGKEGIYISLAGWGAGWRKRQKGGIYISLQDRVSWAGGTQGVSNHVCPHHVTLPLFLCTIFVWSIVYSIIIANSICPNFKMHLFKLKKGICQKGKVFVQIAKRICLNYKIYLINHVFPIMSRSPFFLCTLPSSCLAHVIQLLSIWERNW